MQKRFIEKANEWVSLLGFGCMRFPRKDGKTDMEQVRKMVDYAKSQGVNYFDTAYVYGDGESEHSIADALSKYPRDSYFLADKLPVWAVNEKSDPDKFLDTSLKRLNTDYIDFYLLHALNVENWNAVKRFNGLEWIRKKREEGKIKYIGFSFHDSPQLFREIADAFDWDFVQIQLNYLDWELQCAKELYKVIEEKNMSCIVMEPIRGGALANPPKEVAEILKKADADATPASWALRYCASYPQVKVILSGMSSFENVTENITTLSNFLPLTEEEFNVLRSAAKTIMAMPHISCTGCRYCMPCPKGVNIPGSFAAYNEYMKFKNSDALKAVYNNELKAASPDLCVKCGACVNKCPQHIDIPEELLKLSKVLREAGF